MTESTANNTLSSSSNVGEHFSAFAESNEDLKDVPMRYINRPFPSELDESKVEQFMQDIQKGDDFTPIEILQVKSPEGTRLYSLGGCHRYEAHKRLGKETIRAKVLDTPPSVLKQYLGASA